jgi:hypothetical protein
MWLLVVAGSREMLATTRSKHSCNARQAMILVGADLDNAAALHLTQLNPAEVTGQKAKPAESGGLRFRSMYV